MKTDTIIQWVVGLVLLSITVWVIARAWRAGTQG